MSTADRQAVRSRPPDYDVLVVGGGILGLATARELRRRQAGLRIGLLEARRRPAEGQSGHNSGVLHSGIYYEPGSLKARLCRAGRSAMLGFCAQRGIDVRVDGKVLVASNASEDERLGALLERGQANGLQGIRRLSAGELAEREPQIAAVASAIVPEAGVLDYRQVCLALVEELQSLAVDLHLGTPLQRVDLKEEHLVVQCGHLRLSTRRLLTCAGLYADRVVRASGGEPGATVVPFRGEYCEIQPADCVRALVYPVPDPALPFLGVHLTRSIDGSLHAGPNAVLALSREGYRRQDLNVRDCLDTLRAPGFFELARRQWRHGRDEALRSLVRARFVEEVRKLLPGLRESQVQPAAAGVRAQLLDPDGSLVDDFRFVESTHALHVLNAPSPAATASLAIAGAIVDRAEFLGWF